MCLSGCGYVSVGSEAYRGADRVEFALEFSPSHLGSQVTLTMRYTISDGEFTSNAHW